MNSKPTLTMARTFQLTLAMIGGTLLSTTLPQTAAATPVDDVPAIVVNYDAGSLATEPGLRALYRRLESAAIRVCPAESNRDLAGSTIAKACRDAAVDRAIRQINNPRLAELNMTRAKHG
jgi:UrcA family protein